MKKLDADPRFTSRKLIISFITSIMASTIPIAYKYIGISDAVTMSVLGIISAIALGYGGLNLIEKKLSNGS